MIHFQRNINYFWCTTHFHSHYVVLCVVMNFAYISGLWSHHFNQNRKFNANFIHREGDFFVNHDTMTSNFRPLQITTVGDSIVGKTSMIITYTSNEFPKENHPNSASCMISNISVDGRNFSLFHSDTSGIAENYFIFT